MKTKSQQKQQLSAKTNEEQSLKSADLAAPPSIVTEPTIHQ
jgi:hypothetical protein